RARRGVQPGEGHCGARQTKARGGFVISRNRRWGAGSAARRPKVNRNGSEYIVGRVDGVGSTVAAIFLTGIDGKKRYKPGMPGESQKARMQGTKGTRDAGKKGWLTRGLMLAEEPGR